MQARPVGRMRKSSKSPLQQERMIQARPVGKMRTRRVSLSLPQTHPWLKLKIQSVISTSRDSVQIQQHEHGGLNSGAKPHARGTDIDMKRFDEGSSNSGQRPTTRERWDGGRWSASVTFHTVCFFLRSCTKRMSGGWLLIERAQRLTKAAYLASCEFRAWGKWVTRN